MNVGFFTVYRRDPQHLVHAGGLVEDVRRVMPTARLIHFTDETTPPVPGVDDVQRLPHGPMLERRIEHYTTATADGACWLLLDTDVRVLTSVESIVDGASWDLAIADRSWKDIPQGDAVMHRMPFNTGVMFTRHSGFWADVLAMWRTYAPEERDWLSEQRAVYDVIRTGRYRVRILPGEVYNYPPRRADDPCAGVALAHYKGPARKQWRSDQIREGWAACV